MTAGSNSSATAPAVTAGAANSLLVVMDAVQAGGTSTFGAPSGMTGAYGAPANSPTVAGFTQAIGATGSTGTRTSTISGAQEPVAAMSVLVRPGASSSAVTLSWTATPAANATDYDVQRDGGVGSTGSRATTTTYTDSSPPVGSRTYAVRSVLGGWRAASTSATVNATCP